MSIAPGTWVRVKDTPNLKKWPNWKKAVGFEFMVTKKHTSGNCYLDPDNKYAINYLETDLEIIKKPKMGKKMFKNGDYFSAVYGKIKFRGIVESDTFLDNNQGVGDELDRREDFSHSLDVEGNTEEDLKEAGVTQFKVLKDKRQKAIIDGDKLPEFGTYRVRFDEGEFVFGCGSVKLSPKQIEGYLRHRKRADPVIMEIAASKYVDELSVEELERYLKASKWEAKTKQDREDNKLYCKVVEICETEEESEESLAEYTDEEIEDLLKYPANLAKKL